MKISWIILRFGAQGFFSLLFSEFLRLLYTKGSHLSARQSPCIYHQKGSSITSIYACLLHIGLLFCALQFGIWIFFVGSLATQCSPPCSLSSPLTSPPPPLQTLKPPSICRSCWRTLSILEVLSPSLPFPPAARYSSGLSTSLQSLSSLLLGLIGNESNRAFQAFEAFEWLIRVSQTHRFSLATPPAPHSIRWWW